MQFIIITISIVTNLMFMFYLYSGIRYEKGGIKLSLLLILKKLNKNDILFGQLHCTCVPQHIVKRDVSSTVQPFHLIAHVLEKQLVFVKVHLQSASQQSQQELHPRGGNDTLPNSTFILTSP